MAIAAESTVLDFGQVGKVLLISEGLRLPEPILLPPLCASNRNNCQATRVPNLHLHVFAVSTHERAHPVLREISPNLFHHRLAHTSDGSFIAVSREGWLLLDTLPFHIADGGL